MSKTIRRFSTQGASGALRQLHVDEHGTFMLHSDHLVAINQAGKLAFDLNCQLRQKDAEIAQLKQQLEDVKAEVTAGRGKPHWWAVKHRGSVLRTYNLESLATAAVAVLGYDKGIPTNRLTVEPLWEQA